MHAISKGYEPPCSETKVTPETASWSGSGLLRATLRRDSRQLRSFGGPLHPHPTHPPTGHPSSLPRRMPDLHTLSNLSCHFSHLSHRTYYTSSPTVHYTASWYPVLLQLASNLAAASPEGLDGSLLMSPRIGGGRFGRLLYSIVLVLGLGPSDISCTRPPKTPSNRYMSQWRLTSPHNETRFPCKAPSPGSQWHRRYW